MISKEEEIQIAIKKIIELNYEMYMKDLKSGNISKSIKSYGKIIKKRNGVNNNDNPTLFSYGK